MGKEHKGSEYRCEVQTRKEMLAKDMEKDRSRTMIKVVGYRGNLFIYICLDP